MKTIDVETAKQKLSDAVVIDVLSEVDYQTQHIPGAINVPAGKDHFVRLVEGEVPDKSTPVIVYCADEDCTASPRAARALDEAGFENVFDMEAGIEGWKAAGHDVERGTPQVQADA